jgi:ABC-type uncharacterized transport system permease subunit
LKKVKQIEFTFEVVRIVVGLLVAFGITLLSIIFVAKEPFEAIRNFMIGPFENVRNFGQLMGKYTAYILSGCGMCFIYACGRFNLSGEGIVNFAPIVPCLLLYTTNIMTNLPLLVNLTIILVTCGITGGLVSLIPAYAREKFGASEMVMSIILNYMLLFVSQYILKKEMVDRDISYLGTPLHPDNARFKRFFGDSNFTTAIFVAIAGWIVASIIFDYMRVGAKIKIVGANIHFAEYAGINSVKMMYVAQFIGGVFSGLAGAVDTFGLFGRYQYIALTNIGMDGLIVAVLAKKNPKFVPLSAFVLAYIRSAAVVLNYTTEIPYEFVDIMSAVLVFFVAAQEFLSKPKNKMIFDASREREAERAKEGAKA